MTVPELWTSGWTPALVNHLWQSTVVALLSWLLTLALRNNQARVRYSIWLLASIKFLVPFKLLTSIGALWAKPVSNSQGTPALYLVVEQFSQPFLSAPVHGPGAAADFTTHHFPIVWVVVGIVWLCGFIALLAKWISAWRRAAEIANGAQTIDGGREFDALRRAESKAEIRRPIVLLFSSLGVEPGVFGIFRPVMLWPAGLSHRLNDAEIESIMVHEVEHVRRRDNLTAAIHALVETLFWFHPLVRFMSARMNEERERACDERVIEWNAPPDAYAQSILKVCAFCVEPPTACVSGVSGADLKERILRIMMRRPGVALSSGLKLLLSAAGASILAAPLGFGVLHGQAGPSSGQSATPTPDLPKYEVATIKPSSSNDGRRIMMMTPDGTSLHGIALEMVLRQAFGVEDDRIIGAPSWTKSKQYDIEAKVAPEDAPKMDKLKAEQRREMLLPLLVNRFNLKYHHEKRELPTYALVIAKGGPKLAESKPGEPGPHEFPGPSPGPGGAGKDPLGKRGMISMGPGRIDAHGGGIEFLTHSLSSLVGRTVLDSTGLTGTYDFTLQWTPDDTGMPIAAHGGDGGPPRGDMPADAGGPSLFTALQEQLGLKLEPTKSQVDVIVIDHIDLPSEN